jgi:hypothetical protein
MRPYQWLDVQRKRAPRRWRDLALFLSPWVLLALLDLFGI